MAKKYEKMTKKELIAEIDATKKEFSIRLNEGGEVRDRLRAKLKKTRREARMWRSNALCMCGDRDTWKRYAKRGDEMIRTLRQRAEKWRDRYSYARAELRDAERSLRKERVERLREEEDNGKE